MKVSHVLVFSLYNIVISVPDPWLTLAKLKQPLLSVRTRWVCNYSVITLKTQLLLYLDSCLFNENWRAIQLFSIYKKDKFFLLNPAFLQITLSIVKGSKGFYDRFWWFIFKEITFKGITSVVCHCSPAGPSPGILLKCLLKLRYIFSSYYKGYSNGDSSSYHLNEPLLITHDNSRR